jgi:hypothetical protein
MIPGVGVGAGEIKRLQSPVRWGLKKFEVWSICRKVSMGKLRV